MILSKIDRAICLTLDKRYDMACQLQEQCKEKGINIELFIAGSGSKPLKYDYIDSEELPKRTPYSTDYPTWFARPNALNAWNCHREIFLRCKENENLLLLEDDSELSEDFLEMIEKTEDFFNNNHWDMVYFGCYHFNSLKTEHPNIMKMNGGGGFHGVLISGHVRKELLSFPPIGPYDWIVGKYLHQYYNCYAIYPSIINQKSGFSFVEGCVLNKPDRTKL